MKSPTHSALSLHGLTQACNLDRYGEHIRWAVLFVVLCTALLGGTLLVIWAASGFGDLGVSGHGLVALMLGIVLTSVLGIVLMALSFYSDRNGNDRSGARLAEKKRDAD